MSVAQGLLSHNLSLASVQNPSNQAPSSLCRSTSFKCFHVVQGANRTPYLITSLSALVGVTGRTDYKKLVYITANKQSLECPAAKCGISLHSLLRQCCVCRRRSRSSFHCKTNFLFEDMTSIIFFKICTGSHVQ